MDEGLPSSVDVTPEESSAVERALRNLGVTPVPHDVAVRLERRLEEELGPSPPVRAARRRTRLRPGLVLAPIAAVAAIAAVVVIGSFGGGGEKAKVSAARDTSPPASTAATDSIAPGAVGGAAAAAP